MDADLVNASPIQQQSAVSASIDRPMLRACRSSLPSERGLQQQLPGSLRGVLSSCVASLMPPHSSSSNQPAMMIVAAQATVSVSPQQQTRIPVVALTFVPGACLSSSAQVKDETSTGMEENKQLVPGNMNEGQSRRADLAHERPVLDPSTERKDNTEKKSKSPFHPWWSLSSTTGFDRFIESRTGSN